MQLLLVAVLAWAATYVGGAWMIARHTPVDSMARALFSRNLSLLVLLPVAFVGATIEYLLTGSIPDVDEDDDVGIPRVPAARLRREHIRAAERRQDDATHPHDGGSDTNLDLDTSFLEKR